MDIFISFEGFWKYGVKMGLYRDLRSNAAHNIALSIAARPGILLVIIMMMTRAART